jgi:SPP1 family phage portal protein
MTSQQVIELIKRQSGVITSQIIKDLIEEHKPLKQKTLKFYKAYTGDVPITSRTFTDVNKINNKLNNDFRGDIVDMIAGYLFGHPIVYKIDDTKYSKAEHKRIYDELQSFLIRNSIDDLDSLTGKYTAICSYGARLCYIDQEGKERVMHINPWEVIFVSDATLDELQYAIIYYDVDLIDLYGKPVKRTKVEWYDNKNITYFISDDKGNYILDANVKPNPAPHFFDYIPVVRYINDDTMQGDFEKVEALIDAYDRTMSDIQNEIEEFRLAYFAFYGVDIDEETIRKARQTGGFGFPEGTDGKFITKDLNGAVTFIENHKKTLNENIYKFAKTVDMKDEQFSGSAVSGESRKWKLVGLENKAITKERKFTKATREMFKVIASAWAKKNLKLNYEDLSMQFTRNLPVDLLYYADVSAKLKGQVDEETRLSLLPFVKEPLEVLAKMEKENEAYNLNYEEDENNAA